MLHESHKYKMQKIDHASPFLFAQASRTCVSVSYDAREVILFNKTLSYFEVYAIDDRAFQNDLIGADLADSIDFYTPMVLLSSAICRNVVWHQYKSE